MSITINNKRVELPKPFEGERWVRYDGDIPILQHYDTDRYRDIPMDKLRAMKAEDKYINCYLKGGEVILLSSSIVRLMEVFQHRGWKQTHRGAMVMPKHASRVYRDHSRNIRILINGVKEAIPVSANYWQGLSKSLHSSARKLK